MVDGNASTTHSAHVRVFGLNIKSVYGKFKIVHTNIYHTIESLRRVGNGRGNYKQTSTYRGVYTAHIIYAAYNVALYFTRFCRTYYSTTPYTLYTYNNVYVYDTNEILYARAAETTVLHDTPCRIDKETSIFFLLLFLFFFFFFFFFSASSFFLHVIILYACVENNRQKPRTRRTKSSGFIIIIFRLLAL